MPVINTDSVMNNICKYLESVNFDVKKYIQQSDVRDCYSTLLNNEREYFKSIFSEDISTIFDRDAEIFRLFINCFYVPDWRNIGRICI